MTLALVGALLVGLTMGLLGAGGAILTVPILVYLLGHGEKQAIVESMAIVGGIAAGGAVRAIIRREFDHAVVALYTIPGMIGSAAGAWASRLVPGTVQLMMLAGLMLGVAVLMARADSGEFRLRWGTSRGATIAQGFGIGVLTGLLGVGGGFLIVPSLILLRGLEMPLAVGTSLGVIALNSGAGLGKHLLAGAVSPDWRVIAIFTATGIAGSWLGSHIGTKLDRNMVRRAFSVILVLVAFSIVIREAPHFLRLSGSAKEARP